MATIMPLPNGPLKVVGASLTQLDGTLIDGPDTLIMCRCGQSANKPFCDGSHTGAGFKS